jgi:hypothetical protein
MTAWQLLRHWYRLGGVAWNPAARRAAFRTREAARAFKKIAPGWTVCFTKGGNEE